MRKDLFAVGSRVIFLFAITILSAYVVKGQKDIPIYISNDQKDLKDLAADLSENLAKASGMNFPVQTKMGSENAGIFLKVESVSPQSLKNQGYEIIANDHSVTIRANHVNGLANG